MSAGADRVVRILEGNVPVGLGNDVAVLVGVSDELGDAAGTLAIRLAGGAEATATLRVGDTVGIGGAVWRVTEVRPSPGPPTMPFGSDGSHVVLTALNDDSTQA